MVLVQNVWKKVTKGFHSLMEKHFATDEKSWGSNPYGTSKLRCSSVVEHLIHIQVVRSSILLTATHGGYSLMVGRKLVALHVRVRFSLVTPHRAKQKFRAKQI